MEWLAALALQPLLMLAIIPFLAAGRWLVFRLPDSRLKRILFFSWRI